jgi:hypothetical protein
VITYFVDKTTYNETKKVETASMETDKTEYIKFDFFVLIFKDGCSEEWIKWLMGYRDLEVMMPLKET